MLPRIIHQIWIGPRPAPRQWLDTWREHHPDWRYRLWSNETVFTRPWRNQRLVNAYRDQEEWRGVADVIRYEILHEQGGFMPGADSECLRPVDELFKDSPASAWAVAEQEEVRPGLLTPLYASLPGSPFAAAMVAAVSCAAAGEPWRCVGNRLMQEVYESRDWPDVCIWPSWYFNPEHYTGIKYEGNGKPYARQHWASTRGSYAA